MNQTVVSHAFTPLVHIHDEQLGDLFLKREDLQPTGSHKDRAARYQVARLLDRNARGTVISSSGNAGIAAAHYCRLAKRPCFVFLSRNTPSGKISAILNEDGYAIISDKPVNFARFAARIFDLPDLRPSIDPDAISGFTSLGIELAQQLPVDFSGPLLMFSTSGASLIGLSNGLDLASSTTGNRARPKLFAVQSGRSHSLASRFDPRPFEPIDRLAGQGGLPESNLTEDLKRAIQRSAGGALVCNRLRNSFGASPSIRLGPGRIP